MDEKIGEPDKLVAFGLPTRDLVSIQSKGIGQSPQDLDRTSRIACPIRERSCITGYICNSLDAGLYDVGCFGAESIKLQSRCREECRLRSRATPELTRFPAERERSSRRKPRSGCTTGT